MSGRLTKSDLFVELNDTKRKLMLAERKLAAIAALHKPFPDDGVEYCGWDGVDGCREAWPCRTIRILRGDS